LTKEFLGGSIGEALDECVPTKSIRRESTHADSKDKHHLCEPTAACSAIGEQVELML
jgi:hypothetical protein